MPLVDQEARAKYFKEYHKKWYAKNREKVIAQVNVLKARKRKEWQEFKATLACSKCGQAHPAIIDFHHIDRSHPKHSVNLLISHGRWAKALEEIKKCVVLCANCHRIVHWDEKQAAKRAKAKAAKAKKKPPTKGRGRKG